MDRLKTSVVLKMDDKRLLSYYRSCRDKVRTQYRSLMYYGYSSPADEEELQQCKEDEAYVSWLKQLLSSRGHVRSCHG